MDGRKWIVGAAIAVAAGGLSACSGAGDSSGSESAAKEKGASAMATQGAPAQKADTIYTFTMDRIDGTPESLEDYKGKVVLVVNVASKCGLTPQYAGLEKLYESKKGEGFVILGFPANNFNAQEPGTNKDITAFCTREYGVTFPMFSKISVLGEDQAPLYRMLSSESEAPTWNFTKYLIGRDGTLVKRFDPRTTPQDPELVGAIDRALKS